MIQSGMIWTELWFAKVINKLDIASSDFEQPTENMAHGMIILCTLSYWYIVQVKCNNKWEC